MKTIITLLLLLISNIAVSSEYVIDSSRNILYDIESGLIQSDKDFIYATVIAGSIDGTYKDSNEFILDKTICRGNVGYYTVNGISMTYPSANYYTTQVIETICKLGI